MTRSSYRYFWWTLLTCVATGCASHSGVSGRIVIEDSRVGGSVLNCVDGYCGVKPDLAVKSGALEAAFQSEIEDGWLSEAEASQIEALCRTRPEDCRVLGM